MARKSLRRAQAITPFGIGSIVDFPNQTLMLAGLDVWPDKPDCKIPEDRLAGRLGVEYFRAPPPPPREGQLGDYLPFIRFPLWHFCPRCRSMKESFWNDVNPPRCASTLKPIFPAPACADLPERRRWRMVPVRFIVACENGHIDDFPWLAWAHSRRSQSLDSANICASPMLRLRPTGKAGLMGLYVKCEACDAKGRSLMGSAGPDSLKGLRCSGKRPWLGPNGRENCDSNDPPRMLQKGATNLHFSKVASAILIPPFTDPIRRLLDDDRNWQFLAGATTEDGNPDEARLKMFADYKHIEYPRLKEVYLEKLNKKGVGDAKQSEEQFRYSEFRALLDSPGNENEDFLTVKPDMDDYPDSIRQYFDRIVLVEKLAETRALTGFSRINPPAYREYDREDLRMLSLKATRWLPAVRVYGEGIFFTLREQAVDEWLASADTSRYEDIVQSHTQTAIRLGRTPRPLPTRFFLLHTLAHILIRRLSFECGYGSASLRERLYCDENPKARMYGILIYTAAGDSEGTMGGLVNQGKPDRFESLLVGALEDSIWCSSDPLCVESHGQGIGSLNRAACHACALLPETSCEEGNRFLDRVALIGSESGSNKGYFHDLVKRIVTGDDAR